MPQVVAGVAKVSASKTQLYVFDLDGTLIDATADIVVAVNHTLNHFNKPPLPAADIITHVGHGVRHLLKKTLDLHDHRFEDAFAIMLDYYYDHCLGETFLYPNVSTTLQTLKSQGKTIALCTNKSLKPSEKILDGLGIRTLFDHIVGGDSFAAKKPHPMGLQHILTQTRVAPQRAVMIGDSRVDMEVGKSVGMRTCGCSYGLRPLHELKAAKPDVMINNIAEVLQHFI